MLDQPQREKELEYNRFCSYGVADVLGISIESEYLYIIQSQKISVFEYHGNFDKPQLSEELIHNKVIHNYSINQHYICINSDSLIQVRDRKHWENVIYTHPLDKQSEDSQHMILDHHSLYVSKKEHDNLVFEKIDIETKQISSCINLGKVYDSSLDILQTIKPMFLNQLGMLNDFYIWAKNNKEIELGMLYTSQGISKRKFQINQIEIENGKILQMYHHRVNCIKYPNQSPEYVVIIVQREDKQLYLHYYQILQREHSIKKEEAEVSEFQDKFQGILNQFSFLRNLNEGSTSNSLVQEVLNEAIASDSHEKPQKTHFQVKLQNLNSYQSSQYREGHIWVVSEQKICEIELAKEDSIQNIMKSYKSEQKVVISIIYQDKLPNKMFIGLYKQKLLFSEFTTSFDLAFTREINEQIAQEIEEYEINDQILEKETQVKINAEAEKLRNDFLLLTLAEKQKEIEENIEKEQKSAYLLADCFSQTEIQAQPTKEYGMQTINIEEKPIPIGLEQIQDLVAKYSSAFSVSCTKVKQNSYIKDKFDRQIYNIVDNVVKDSVQPFLQSKFVSYLEGKIKDISQHISTVFETQLEGLNEYMRKNEAKESNLRGRRIFQFSNQVNNIRDTVAVITDSLKANEVHKYAFNELILEQAKEMKAEIIKIERSITDLEQKNQTSEKQIADQITEIFELVKTLQEKHKQNIEEDSSCIAQESENESEQREKSETSEQQSFSQDSHEEIQREEMHYRYPPYHHHYASRGFQEHKKNKKSFELENKGYTPYPSPEFYHAPTQMPYYYPFMPHVPPIPMQGYYPPNYSYPIPKEEHSRIQSKKGKSRKAKKSD